MADTALIEDLERERHRIHFWFLITYAVWFGAFVLSNSGWFPRSVVVGLGGFAALVSLLWCGTSIWLARWAKRVRSSPQALAALNDELTVRNRWRAQRASAFVVLVCLMLGVVVTTFVDISGRLVMLMLIWVLVVSQIGCYLWYDRSE